MEMSLLAHMDKTIWYVQSSCPANCLQTFFSNVFNNGWWTPLGAVYNAGDSFLCAVGDGYAYLNVGLSEPIQFFQTTDFKTFQPLFVPADFEYAFGLQYINSLYFMTGDYGLIAYQSTPGAYIFTRQSLTSGRRELEYCP
jgi:hypothetical protein